MVFTDSLSHTDGLRYFFLTQFQINSHLIADRKAIMQEHVLPLH